MTDFVISGHKKTTFTSLTPEMSPHPYILIWTWPFPHVNVPNAKYEVRELAQSWRKTHHKYEIIRPYCVVPVAEPGGRAEWLTFLLVADSPPFKSFIVPEFQMTQPPYVWGKDKSAASHVLQYMYENPRKKRRRAPNTNIVSCVCIYILILNVSI